jgi:hypothetical protein
VDLSLTDAADAGAVDGRDGAGAVDGRDGAGGPSVATGKVGIER